MLADSANPAKDGDAKALAYLHQKVDMVASPPKRRRDIRLRFIPLAVLFFAATALPHFNQNHADAVGDLALVASQHTEAVAGSSSIADEALKDIGTWQGQCFTWVKEVVDRATPYTMGYGY